MKKLLYLGIAVALTMGFGCAITDYALITSNNQSGPVNTNGKALIKQSVQVATSWPDGTDCIVWYVDQAANGDRTLTNYDLFTPAGSSLSPFQDTLYCNPGWNGCSSVTASDPQVGDVDPFDYRFNSNCAGARSLSLLLGTSRYYGECGRTVRPSISQRLELAMSGKESAMFGQNGMLYNVGPQNLTISLTNERNETFLLPINGHTQLWMQLGRGSYKGWINASNPVLATTVRAYGQLLNNMTYGQTTATITYAGVPITMQIAGNRGGVISSVSHVSELANRF